MNVIKAIALWFFLISGVLIWLAILIVANGYMPKEHVYDCNLAEISPDYPREVVNECRRIRSGKSVST